MGGKITRRIFLVGGRENHSIAGLEAEISAFGAKEGPGIFGFQAATGDYLIPGLGTDKAIGQSWAVPILDHMISERNQRVSRLFFWLNQITDGVQMSEVPEFFPAIFRTR